METGGGNLESATECKADPAPKAKPSKNQARGHKILFLAMVFPVLKKG
jgi:hypothetical protein